MEKSAIAKTAPYFVFFTWDINRHCNYKCSYCNQTYMEVPYPGVNKWIEIWDGIYKRYGSCHIHISGGEPFIYPDFIELITLLSKKHTLEFSTNLSFDVETFIENITPQRARVGVSFHPEFLDFDTFSNKTALLKEKGFDVWVNYVAYPPLLDAMADYRKKIKDLGITFSILPFNGEFEGRKYPQGYTEEEKKKLMIFDEKEKFIKNNFEWKTDKSKSETKNKLCRMGQLYARIEPDAEAYRCCVPEGRMSLGNLLKGTFKLLDGSAVCTHDECPCWKCMLVKTEKDWLPHWPRPH